MDEFPKTWELVTEDGGFTTYRLRVPGGWLVIVNNAPTFLPDPQGSWVLET